MLSVSCGQPPAASSSNQAPRAEVEPAATARPDAPVDEYLEHEFPPTTRAWTVADFEAARDALVAIELARPELLPRADGPKAEVVARLSDPKAVATALSGIDDIEVFLRLGEAQATVHQLYGTRVARGEGYGSEFLGTSTAYLAVAAKQFRAVVDALKLDVAKLQADQTRLEGLLKMRYGLRATISTVMFSPFEAPGVVDAQEMVAQLGIVLADLAPLLLPEEAVALRDQLDELARAGARAPDLQRLRQALADDVPRHPLVSGLLAQHREYGQRTDARMASALENTLTPIDRGPEGSGHRYEFAGGGFSAVFDSPPHASVQQSLATDGVAVRVQTLGLRDATGLARSVVCSSRPTPGAESEAFARQVIDAMKPDSSKEVTLSGRVGLEASVSRDGRQALLRAFSHDNAGCMIIAEYPAALAVSAAVKARAFVDSVQLPSRADAAAAR